MKYTFINLIFIISYLSLFGWFFSNVIVYPGFLQNNLPINVLWFVLVFSILSAIIIWMNQKQELSNTLHLIFTVNNTLVLPGSLLATCIFSYIELTHFPNYVFSRYGIHYFDFLYLFFLAFATFSIKLLIESKYRKFVTLLSIALAFAAVVFYTYPHDVSIKVSAEDGILEYFQFFFYLLSGIFALYAARSLLSKNRKLATLYFLFGLFSIFVAGEEISWGQRWWNYSVPVIQQSNYKDEINVHNHNAVGSLLTKAYVVAGLYGAFAHMLLKRLKYNTTFICPPKEYFLYFIPISIVYLYIIPVDRIYQEEVAETLFSLGIMLYLILVIQQIGTNITQKSVLKQ